MEHIDDAINLYTENLDSFQTISKLLEAYAEAHNFLQTNEISFEALLGKELSDNKDYYDMFPISYYKKLCHSKGLAAALAEINHDVNIRAFTFYNAAHNKYLFYLHVIKELMESLAAKDLSDETPHNI